MQRRNFLKMLAAAGVFAVNPLPGAVRQAVAQPGSYSGPVLITFNLGGGWDQGSLADPRENPNINRWAQNQPAGQAGNLRFSPLSGQAQPFYQKYFQSMMVINGVDLQTNGHAGGSNHRNTGSLGGDYPSTGELLAAVYGAGMPAPFVRLGGFRSRGVVPATDSPDQSLLLTLAAPNTRNGTQTLMKTNDLDIVRRYRLERLQALRQRPDNLPRWQAKYDELLEARTGGTLLDRLAQALPGQLDQQRPDGANDGLVPSLHMVLVTMLTGMTISANVGFGGFDSHGNNDGTQSGLITRLLGLIDYIMGKAEQLGIGNRLYVHVTSDVGRTPRYNGGNGKDHWSISSDLLLKQNASWGNRHAGLSSYGDTGRQPINFQTLAADNGGRQLTPKHVLNELRHELGIAQNNLVRRYPLTDERVALFNPGAASTIRV